MKRLVSVCLAVLVALSSVGSVFAQTASPEGEGEKRTGISEWYERGYEDGSQGRNDALFSACVGANAGSCLVFGMGWTRESPLLLRSTCAGGVVGSLALSAGELIGGPQPSVPQLSVEEADAYLRGYKQAKSRTRKDSAAVGIGFAVAWGAVGLFLGTLLFIAQASE